MFVLGHGAAGKTTLLRALNYFIAKQKIPEDILTLTPSTIGFDSIELKLPDKVKYNVFDFAGELGRILINRKVKSSIRLSTNILSLTEILFIL